MLLAIFAGSFWLPPLGSVGVRLMSKLALKARLYRNTSGNYNSPTWAAVNRIKDLTVNAGWDMADADSRESRIKNKAKTLLDLSASGMVKVSNTDEGYIALWEAAHDDDPLDLLILNGAMDENGARGYRGYWQVSKSDEDQSIGNVLYMGIELTPADNDGDIPMKKAVVTGGSPVFSDIPT